MRRLEQEPIPHELPGQRRTRRQVIATLGGAAIGFLSLGALKDVHTTLEKPFPTFPSSPTSEPISTPEPVDISQKDAEFRLLSEIPLKELGVFNRDMIYEIARKFSEFDLPQEVIVKKDWRDIDGGYTSVTPRNAELSAESGELVIFEPGRIEISSDLFRGDVRLSKREIELQHAAAKLIFTNFTSDYRKEQYAYAHENGALSALGILLLTYNDYKEKIKDPKVDNAYKNGFYVFNEYDYTPEDDRDESDLPRQNGRMEGSIEDYAASVINTAMLYGYKEDADCMAQRVYELPTILSEVPAGMGVTGRFYYDSPSKVLALNGYDETINLLRTLVKPDVRKPENAPGRLIHNLSDIYLTMHAVIQKDSQPEVNF